MGRVLAETAEMMAMTIVQSCVLSEVIGIAWAVHHVGACVAHTEQFRNKLFPETPLFNLITLGLW